MVCSISSQPAVVRRCSARPPPYTPNQAFGYGWSTATDPDGVGTAHQP